MGSLETSNISKLPLCSEESNDKIEEE